MKLLHKLIAFVALFSACFAYAQDEMFVIGPGTVAGWSLDRAIEMNKIDNEPATWAAVVWLGNDGTSFRLQSTREFTEDGNNYFTAGNTSELINNEATPMHSGNGDCFSAETPGVYLITAISSGENKSVQINRMSQVYLVGDISGGSVKTDFPLTNSNENPHQYSGIFNLATGSFKISVNAEKGLDNRFFLMKEDKRHFAQYLDRDSKWEIGFPYETEEEYTDAASGESLTHKVMREYDLDPGTYQILLDAAHKQLSYTRMAQCVSISGHGVGDLSWSTDANNIPFEKQLDEDGNWTGAWVRKHLFFHANSAFKPIIDGKFYGSDTWTEAVVSDGATVYLRNADNGADLRVTSDGFRTVTIAPSPAGDGTMSIIISAPEAVWVEGLCDLQYNSESASYYDMTNPYPNWVDAGKEYKVMINGDAVGVVQADVTGWYEPSITFDVDHPWQTNYNLRYLAPVITDGENEIFRFSENDLASVVKKYIHRRIYLEEGKSYFASLDKFESINKFECTESGYYNLHLFTDASTTEDGEETRYLKLYWEGPFVAYMPLKESDFADGQKHYFLVGQRTAAWRLQPEWEFKPQADGTLVIPARLLYNGYYMIGVVDNYEDYILQNYRGFTHTDINANIAIDPRTRPDNNPLLDNIDKDVNLPLCEIKSLNHNGCADGKFTALRYNDIDQTSPARQHGGHYDQDDGAQQEACYGALRSRAIEILSARGLRGDDQDEGNMQSHPSRVSSIVLNLDDNLDPASIEFNGISTNSREVAKLMCFTLVGGGIKNDKIEYSDIHTSPMNRIPTYGGKEWSESWIQFDAKGKPYVDGNGEYVYQTSFTSNWLSAHPSYFNFGDDFSYSSSNITFHYDESITHPDQFGQRDYEKNGATHHEYLHTYWSDESTGNLNRNVAAKNSLDDKMIIPADERVCYVVEDMWMEGMFRIWSGWGGASTNYEYYDHGQVGTRWYMNNASHGAIHDDRATYFSASKLMGFTLFEDIPEANFGVGYGQVSTDDKPNEKVEANGSIVSEHKLTPARRFFKRIEIWYNLKSGFAYQGKDDASNHTASVMLFYQEQGGPVITAAKHSANQLKFTYEIPLDESTPEETDRINYGKVVWYKVERLKLNEDGSEDEAAWITVDEKNINVERTDFGKSEHQSAAPSYARATENGTFYVVDPSLLGPGDYRYRISTKRELSGDEILTAKSNILTIEDELPGTTSGVEKVTTANTDGFHFDIYHTRGSDSMFVDANDEIDTLRIFSLDGKLMLITEISSANGYVDLSTLPAGVYLLNVNGVTQRFLH